MPAALVLFGSFDPDRKFALRFPIAKEKRKRERKENFDDYAENKHICITAEQTLLIEKGFTS